MSNILKKAKEGGYGYPNGNKDKTTDKLMKVDTMNADFWIALGKACGWESIKCLDMRCGLSAHGELIHESLCPLHIYGVEKSGWKEIALHFHEINLTEGWDKAVSYLEELIIK